MLFFHRHTFFQSTESGVEILVNEPYDDGPGGSGQFTHKVRKNKSTMRLFFWETSCWRHFQF